MIGRGRPFELGNTYGQGRPPGSRNKKSVLLQKKLLENADQIVGVLIDRAFQGDRFALTLCIERLIPRLKTVEELPFEQIQEHDQMLLSKEQLAPLTDDELVTFYRIVSKIAIIQENSPEAALEPQPAAEPKPEPEQS